MADTLTLHPPFPVPPNRFWAKLHPRENPQDWHPLLAHSADVAAVVQAMLAPGSVLADRLAGTLGLAQLTHGQRARLIFLAAMHDMGKVNHGFNTKARPADQRGRWVAQHRGHVKVLLDSMAAIPPLKSTIHREVLTHLGGDLDVAATLLVGAIAHHGRPWLPQVHLGRRDLWARDPSTGRDPLAEIRRLAGHARKWSLVEETAGDSIPVTPAFSHLYAGVVMLADWIGSTLSAFPCTPWADDDPDRYWREQAVPRAIEATARIGVVPRTRATSESPSGPPLLGALFPALFGDSRNVPTPLQIQSATMQLPAPGSYMLMESETGSGKTEAALVLYARLRAAGLVGGLMFALPTRATASAMHQRVTAALEGLYVGKPRPTVTLAVGGQQPHVESTEPRIADPGQTWDDSEEQHADRQQGLESWASTHAKKYLAAEIVVGTLDQVLLATLPVKHAHLRLAALSRHLLIVDELHSFDRYMRAALDNVLGLLRTSGGYALFMSATVSEAARQQLGGGPAKTLAAAESLPYPVLSVSESEGFGWVDHAVEQTGRVKGVRWRTSTEAEGFEAAAAAAEAGARVLVLCNTVRRARNAVASLSSSGREHLLWRPVDARHVPPYHSRYTPPDRAALDGAVQVRFGKPAAARVGGVILVSTQLVEQSLDLDFDLLITDLCPVDVLLQRIGRLHRHAERDPHRPAGLRGAEVLVLAPEAGFTPHLGQDSLDLGWGEKRPYFNYADGELTLRAIEQNPTIEIPRDNRRLVEGVYHPDVRHALWTDEAWEKYLCKVEGVELNQTWLGKEVVLDFEEGYIDCARRYNDDKRLIRTRLGDETVRVALDRPVAGYYSALKQSVNYVDLPIWALPRDRGVDPELRAIADPGSTDAPAFKMMNRLYRYTTTGWTWGRA